MKKIILGVTSSISAYKACDLTRLLYRHKGRESMSRIVFSREYYRTVWVLIFVEKIFVSFLGFRGILWCEIS